MEWWKVEQKADMLAKLKVGQLVYLWAKRPVAAKEWMKVEQTAALWIHGWEMMTDEKLEPKLVE
jgi:hypothetical protein